MSLRFSAAGRPGARALLDLYQHAWWTRERTLAQVSRLLKHSHLCVCAWNGRQLAGFARVSTDFTFRAVIWDVIVREGFSSLGEMDDSEEDLLDRAWGLEPNSRLSCQAILSQADVTIEIPKYSINHAKEG